MISDLQAIGSEHLLVSSGKPCLGVTSRATQGGTPIRALAQGLKISQGLCGQNQSSGSWGPGCSSTPATVAVGASRQGDSSQVKHPAPHVAHFTSPLGSGAQESHRSGGLPSVMGREAPVLWKGNCGHTQHSCLENGLWGPH